jgi:Zn-dependent membrane protease YugP
MLSFRSTIVPVVNVAGTALPWLSMFGIFFAQRIPGLLLLAIVAQAAVTLFTLITLPVEFDASRRALAWMQQRGIVVPQEYDAAKDALKWAAMTYVVAALAAVTQLIYLISRYNSRR